MAEATPAAGATLRPCRSVRLCWIHAVRRARINWPDISFCSTYFLIAWAVVVTLTVSS